MLFVFFLLDNSSRYRQDNTVSDGNLQNKSPIVSLHRELITASLSFRGVVVAVVTYVSDAGGRRPGGSCLRSGRSARCVSGTGRSLSAGSPWPSALAAGGPGPTTRGREREAGRPRLRRPRGGLSASTPVYAPIRYLHVTHLLHGQRTSQTLRCYAASVTGRRRRVGMGNASSPTYVRSSYQVGKTRMINYKNTIVLLEL